MFETSASEFELLILDDSFMNLHFESFIEMIQKPKCPYSNPKINFYLSLFPWSS